MAVKNWRIDVTNKNELYEPKDYESVSWKVHLPQQPIQAGFLAIVKKLDIKFDPPL